MSDLRIAVLGSGANGAGIGSDLLDAGLDVTFVEQWPAHVEAIRQHGITVHSGGRTTVTPVDTLHLTSATWHRCSVSTSVMKLYDSIDTLMGHASRQSSAKGLVFHSKRRRRWEDMVSAPGTKEESRGNLSVPAARRSTTPGLRYVLPSGRPTAGTAITVPSPNAMGASAVRSFRRRVMVVSSTAAPVGASRDAAPLEPLPIHA